MLNLLVVNEISYGMFLMFLVGLSITSMAHCALGRVFLGSVQIYSLLIILL